MHGWVARRMAPHAIWELWEPTKKKYHKKNTTRAHNLCNQVWNSVLTESKRHTYFLVASLNDYKNEEITVMSNSCRSYSIKIRVTIPMITSVHYNQPPPLLHTVDLISTFIHKQRECTKTSPWTFSGCGTNHVLIKM